MSEPLIVSALDRFRIELPSWGFADTGTRFGVFRQPAAARTLEEKIADAGFVHGVTGVCPTVALHVLWDLPGGLADVEHVRQAASNAGVSAGAINPNWFQDQAYKHGSFGHTDPAVRRQAIDHGIESVAIAAALGSRDVSCWFADGSNYPGTANIRERKRWFEEGLRELHAHLAPGGRLLVEYKPFEPAFYHTDIADWGMSASFARAAGPRAKVLVDTGHHLPGCNIEHIVAFLIDEGLLGGFHFNDRKYADDDLTMGSIDPYQLFRIFAEITLAERERGSDLPIAYMIDQSHNIKPKIEAMIQTVMTAQEHFVKAMLVDHGAADAARKRGDVVMAERALRDAYATDVRAFLEEYRAAKGLARDPLVAFRESGYEARVARERGPRKSGGGSSYA